MYIPSKDVLQAQYINIIFSLVIPIINTNYVKKQADTQHNMLYNRI